MNTIFGTMFLIYCWLYIRGLAWTVHAIFAIGGVIMQIGIDVRKPAGISIVKLILASFLAIPGLGLFAIGPKKFFNTVREKMIADVTQLLLTEGVAESTKKAFEASVRANLG